MYFPAKRGIEKTLNRNLIDLIGVAIGWEKFLTAFSLGITG
jgi:hypothetical protein